MAKLLDGPAEIVAAGNRPKTIEEFIGRVNSRTESVSIARMTSPEGWTEPGQTPEFAEYTVVLRGTLRATTENGTHDVSEGQALIAEAGEWVQYSTPFQGGADYMSVCLPAFSSATVHRDEP